MTSLGLHPGLSASTVHQCYSPIISLWF